ncbi:retrovirus-related pol polyprotein from transposon TNT 1-94 [Tanacetum coccineum]|uniref:Retrovirus-related pol polyprotein from transposon TNT 1-94 n=1 Tax=Tanacetum coccineum TaxID=301880 RepID=A0ABQ5ADH5_9ASTR
MDLCGPMRVASINGKKYILVIVDDYSWFTWAPIRRIRTDNGTEFVNQTLHEYYEKVGISHETSVARSLQQNGVVERCNRTLIEVARTMLIYAKAMLFLWAEAVATACYTQNCSIIRLCHGKTPYELLHDKLPELSFFHVFCALYYLTNDSENLGKLQPKADIDFDELTTMASEHNNLEPAFHEMSPATISSGIVRNPPPSTPFVPPSRTDWDLLFQPLFDELLNPPSSVDHPSPEVIAPIVEAVAPEPALQSVYLPQQLLTKMHHLLNIPLICCSHEYDSLLNGCKDGILEWHSARRSLCQPTGREFSKGTVDPTLFIRRQGKDILLVQIYVDDIIFVSTTPELCDQFSKIMCSKFDVDDGQNLILSWTINFSKRGREMMRWTLRRMRTLIWTRCDEGDEDDVMDVEIDEEAEEEDTSAPACPVVVALYQLLPRLRRRLSRLRPMTRLLALSSPPASPLSPWSSSPPQIPFPLSPPSPVLTAPPPSPIRSLGYRAATIRMRAEAAATSHSLPLPPPFIPQPGQMQHHPCLHFTWVPYGVGESSTPLCRPVEVLGQIMAFVATMDRGDSVVRYRVGWHTMREFESMVRRETDEIYTRLDDEQGQRQLLAGRVNMLFRDRRTHAHTRQLMETEAGMSREAWGRAMDASDLVQWRETIPLQGLVTHMPGAGDSLTGKGEDIYRGRLLISGQQGQWGSGTS